MQWPGSGDWRSHLCPYEQRKRKSLKPVPSKVGHKCSGIVEDILTAQPREVLTSKCGYTLDVHLGLLRMNKDNSNVVNNLESSRQYKDSIENAWLQRRGSGLSVRLSASCILALLRKYMCNFAIPSPSSTTPFTHPIRELHTS